MNDLMEWLGLRMHGVPDTLRARVVEALEAARRHSGTVAQEESGNENLSPFPFPLSPFRAAAESLLRRVVKSGEDADPIDLLAADALITYACEAVSEMDPGGLADFR